MLSIAYGSLDDTRLVLSVNLLEFLSQASDILRYIRGVLAVIGGGQIVLVGAGMDTAEYIRGVGPAGIGRSLRHSTLAWREGRRLARHGCRSHIAWAVPGGGSLLLGGLPRLVPFRLGPSEEFTDLLCSGINRSLEHRLLQGLMRFHPFRRGHTWGHISTTSIRRLRDCDRLAT